MAQRTLLNCCRVGGLREEHMLADDLPPPRGPVAFALAADDAMVYARDQAAGRRAVRIRNEEQDDREG